MNLRHATFSAGRWTSASTVLATGLQVLQTVALARILMPADFGLMAVAGAVIGVLALVVDLGFSQAVIHFDEMPVEHRASLYWLNMGLAVVLMALLMLAAPLLGMAYHSAPLTELLRWVALVFPLTATGQQLRALAERELRFDVLAINNVVAAAVALVCAVVAALLGAGVYALVVGALTSAALNSALAWARLPAAYRPTRHFRLGDAKPYLGFGGYLVGESLLNVLHRNADVFVGGLVVGPGPIGLYSVPRDLSLRGAMIVNSVVTKVGFPVMSRVKHEPERLKAIYLQTLHMTASVNFPLYVALGMFASEVVNLLYGTQWHEAATYLRILAAWGLIRSVGNPVGSLIYATGRPKRAFWWSVALLVTVPPLLWLATWLGHLTGLSIAMLALQGLIVVPAWRFLVRPCCGARFGEYMSQFGTPLFCALVAGAIAWLAAHDLPHGTLRLAVGCIVGGVIYLGFSWFLNRRWVNAMLELMHLKKFATR